MLFNCQTLLFRESGNPGSSIVAPDNVVSFLHAVTKRFAA